MSSCALHAFFTQHIYNSVINWITDRTLWRPNRIHMNRSQQLHGIAQMVLIKFSVSKFIVAMQGLTISTGPCSGNIFWVVSSINLQNEELSPVITGGTILNASFYQFWLRKQRLLPWKYKSSHAPCIFDPLST